jgi:hypothetical protein
MIPLRSLEYAVGLFVVAYVAWQIIVPLLMGKKPFSKERKK